MEEDSESHSHQNQKQERISREWPTGLGVEQYERRWPQDATVQKPVQKLLQKVILDDVCRHTPA